MLMIATAIPASAQMIQPIPGVTSNSAIDTLSMHLRTLAASPRNLSALLGAGQAAIDVGDPNAALGFFARAEDIDPRSGPAKAGLGSALVLLEKPDDALRVFGEAVSLGVSESAVAKDRGLAYDLRGDNRRAQRDYAAALRTGPDDEVTRRYALSLGISGDRSQALAMLDPLLRRQDQGAWRARAFIMAMNNDLSGANAIARQVMPANLASTMSPFLSRLGRLNAAERAHAVNFGTVPSDGQSFAIVQTGDPYKPSSAPSAGDGLIPAGVPLGRQSVAAATIRAPAPKPAAIASPTPAAAPGFTTSARVATSTRIGTRVGMRIAAVDPAKLPPEARGDAASKIKVTTMTALPPPDNVRVAVQTAPTPLPPVITTPLPRPAAVEADPGLVAPTRIVGPPADAEPRPAPAFEVAAPVAVPPKPAPPASRLASILAGIEPEAETAPAALPSIAEARAAKRLAARKAAASAEATAAIEAAKVEKARELAAAKANPARLWVQVATGNNERGLGITWRKIREANATLLKTYGGYSAPYKATNRVLAGPVKSSADARALVNALGKAGVSATTYSSEAGQEVVKLSAK